MRKHRFHFQRSHLAVHLNTSQGQENWHKRVTLKIDFYQYADFQETLLQQLLGKHITASSPMIFRTCQQQKKREKNPTTTTKQAATTDLFATFKLFVLALDVLFQLSNLLLDLVDLLVVLLQAALFPQLAGLHLLNGLHPFLLHCHQGRLKHHSTMSPKGHRSHHCVTEMVVCWFCACLSLWFVGPNGL